MSSRVFVANGDVQVEVEGEEEFVEKKLAKLLPLVMGDGGEQQGAALRKKTKEVEETGEKETSNGRPSQTLKTYIKAKAPENVSEAIALVVDYGLKYDRKDEMSSDEIRRALIQGGYRPGKSIAQALADCRRRYGYVEVGSKKGRWKLSSQGETVVELDLPRSKKAEA